MNTISTESNQQLPFTSSEWDKLRYLFQDSIMAKTNLCKLAKNLGTSWPIRGRDETPEKYISHNLEALADMCEFYGKGNRLALLYSILIETQTLDDPFSDMVSHFDKTTEQEDEATMALKEWEVPVDYPVSLVNFGDQTQELCRAEKIETLQQFNSFAQASAKTFVISGDYRRFLNSLMQLDIKVLKEFLPIRENERGLFLAEAIGHLAGRLSDKQAASLIAAFNLKTAKTSWLESNAMSKTDTLALIAKLKESVIQHFELMPEQTQQLRHAVQSGEAACVRFFISLGDPDLESLALAVGMAALDAKPRFKGLIGRFIT